MSIEEFIVKYKAVKNPFQGGYIFGYSDEEWEFISKQNPDNVWTWTSCGDEYGTEQLCGGIHKVNNLGEYLVTEIPSEGWHDFVEIKDDYIRVMQGDDEMGTVDEFIEKCKAKSNNIHPENGFLFKETEEELEFIKAQDVAYVWTYYETSDDYCDYTGLVKEGLLPSDEEQYDNVEWVFKGYFVIEKPPEWEDSIAIRGEH